MLEVGLPGQGAGMIKTDGYKPDVAQVVMQYGGVSDPITALSFASDICGDLINEVSVTYPMPKGAMTFTKLPEPRIGLRVQNDAFTKGLWLLVVALAVLSVIW